MEKYTLIELIYEGSFSKVFTSYKNNENDEIVIIKITKDKLVENEIELHSQLVHKNIVSYLESFQFQDSKCISLEYCNQISLKYYKVEGDLKPFIDQIIEGLNFIHSKGIIHRDIKPQNIFVHNNIPKIGDFGLSIKTEEKFIKTSRVGTPCYTSPEIMSGKYYNNKTDVWSLGCTIYYLIAKTHLFKGTSIEDLKDKIQNKSFYIPFNFKHRKLIMSMLKKNIFFRLNLNDLSYNSIDEDEQNQIEVETLDHQYNNFYIGDLVIINKTTFKEVIDVRKVENEENYIVEFK